MAELMREALEAGDYAQLSTGVFIGLVGALFVALMWLRIWRWLFALMGLRA